MMRICVTQITVYSLFGGWVQSLEVISFPNWGFFGGVLLLCYPRLGHWQLNLRSKWLSAILFTEEWAL